MSDGSGYSRRLLAVVCAVISSVLVAQAQHSRSVTLKPYPETERTDTWPVTLGALEDAVYEVNIVQRQVFEGKTNVLRSSAVQDPTGEDYFIWRPEGDQSGTHYKYGVANSALIPAQTIVHVDCEWGVEGGGGGSGGGGTIKGWAEGQAQVTNASSFRVKAAKEATGVGTVIGMAAYADGDLPVKANWSIESGSGQFEDQSQQVESVDVTSMVPGNVTVRGTCCRNSALTDTGTGTFVAVTSISAEPALVCAGTWPDFTVTTSPEGYANLVNIAFNANTPGAQEAVATCGSSSASTWVTVVKAEFVENDVVKLLGDGAYDPWGNLTEDSFDPEGFVWSLSTIEGDETAEIDEETGYIMFGGWWGKYAVRVKPASLETCFAEMTIKAFVVQLESTETSLANHPSPVDPNDVYSYTEVRAQTLPATDGLSISAAIIYADPDIEGDNGEIASFVPSGDVGKYVSIYEAKSETQSNKCADDLVLIDQSIKLAPFFNDQQCGDEHSLSIMSYFRKLKTKDKFQEAIAYVSSKYNINQAATYDPTLQSDGDTDEWGNVRIGPPAFMNENHLASTLIHEQTHANQGYDLIMAAKAAQLLYYMGVRNTSVCPYPFAEHEALSSERENFTRTCLSDDEQSDVWSDITYFQEIANECGCY